MGYYYYLAPQLSYLVYGQEIPMSSAAFINLALDTMSSDDAALLDYCTLDPDPVKESGGSSDKPLDSKSDSIAYAEPVSPSHSEFIDKWREWERTLRLNLARNRALKLKREIGVEVPEYPADAVLTAKNAMSIESPLEAELFLDKARWDAIESFQGINVFSESAMYAYLLKLLLLERKASFNAEEGFTEYKALYTAILGEHK